MTRPIHPRRPLSTLCPSPARQAAALHRTRAPVLRERSWLAAAPSALVPWELATPSLLLLAAVLAGWGAVAWRLGRQRGVRRLAERVARAEHELRGPVSVLRLTCERMARETAGRRYARSLEVEIERLGAALADLQAARSGRRSAPAGPTRPDDLRALADGVLAGWAPALRAAGRRTRFDWKAGRVAVPGDRGRVAQVLGNLLANAAEHGAGEVELRGRRVPDGVRVEVRNRVTSAQPQGPAAEGSSRARTRRLAHVIACVLRPIGSPRRDRRSRRRRAASSRGHGLSIAADAARELGGSVEVTRDDRVFVARLELPLSTDPDAGLGGSSLSLASNRMRERLAEQGETRRARPRRPRARAAATSTRAKGPTRPPGAPPGEPRPQPRPPTKPPRVNRPPVSPPRRNMNARRM